MNLAEATRQYQAALEADRGARAMFDGVLSAEDELEESAAEVIAARDQMRDVWRGEVRHQQTEGPLR